MWQSVRVTVVAWTLTSTSSSAGSGRLDLRDPEDLGWAVSVVHHGLHDSAPALLSEATVSTTLPVFCPVSTYFVASTTSSRRIGPVDDRPVLPGLDELLDAKDVLLRVARNRQGHALVADPSARERQRRDVPHEAEVGRDEETARLERAAAPAERLLADRVEDRVIDLAVPREVFLRVIEDLVGAERAHELEILRVRDRRHVGARGLGQLHAGRSDRAGRAVDDDALTGAEVGLLQARDRDARPVGERRRLLEAQPCGLVRESTLLADADVLGVRAPAEPEDLVSDCELGHGCADRLDDAGELHSDDAPLRAAETREDAGEERIGRSESAVGAGDRRRVDL